LLVDDSPVLLRALRQRLSQEHDLRVVGEATSGADALRQAARLRPDVCVMDIRMPAIDGIKAAAGFARRLPACRVVILSLYDDTELRERASAAGAAAFVTKHEPPDVLVAAIRDAAPADIRHQLSSESLIPNAIYSDTDGRGTGPEPRTTTEASTS
jgi:DNA-binding NarL/FixJ family response regulator